MNMCSHASRPNIKYAIYIMQAASDYFVMALCMEVCLA